MAGSTIPTVVSAYVLTAISYVIIVTRVVLRRLKHQSLKPDDYLMLIGMVFYAFITAVYPNVVSPRAFLPSHFHEVLTISRLTMAVTFEWWTPRS